ncbi:hypothetical protein Q763_00655 [Flavobacterium beibuense F44-8]|uniref:Acetyltransferase n=1 Tax=Flavobacterium beibuense F44-8 TaxID=1406840 RepID=A0A0A2LYK4_9FLAO|nr:acyltransferase [Flavobacterium beibuense]KGO84288.1 hypothetical protein Q763_00655 [Flavobacterium beibuense F44-8]
MKKIKHIFKFLKNTLITNYIYLSKDIVLGRKVFFKQMPYILKHKNAIIEIGDNTIINSSNYGYHINMFSRCKLYADRENALIKIGENCRIHGTCIHAYNKIEIGRNCLIAANTQIIDGNGHNLCMDEPEKRLISSDIGKEIIIGKNVWIGANTIILGGSVVGEGSIIMAGSVVKGIVKPKCIYGGNPAKLIKKYD